MIQNQVLQSTIDGIKNISHVDLCAFDTDGNVLATTFPGSEELKNAATQFVDSPADSQVMQGNQFFKIYDEKQLEVVIVAKGDGDDTYMMGKLAAFQISSLIVAYRERYDKDNFIKNLLLDNLLLVDIYSRAKKLHIETEARRVVYTIETHRDKDSAALETVKSLFANSRSRDFITAVDEKSIIIVKELKPTGSYEDLEKTGKMILDNLNTEAMSRVNIAYGTIVSDIRDVSRSYKESKMALEVGRIFFSDQNIVAYSSLGIGRLIYQLPVNLCKMYIKEVFDNRAPEEFEEETISTVNQFFADSLNVSETSRNLYIHRNTLVYRLDRIQKEIGLDLRNFDDAVTFKIALMVVEYLKYIGNVDPTIVK